MQDGHYRDKHLRRHWSVEFDEVFETNWYSTFKNYLNEAANFGLDFLSVLYTHVFTVFLAVETFFRRTDTFVMFAFLASELLLFFQAETSTRATQTVTGPVSSFVAKRYVA